METVYKDKQYLRENKTFKTSILLLTAKTYKLQLHVISLDISNDMYLRGTSLFS